MSGIEVYKRQGFGEKIGFGRQMGLLIVDFVEGFADPDQFGGGNIPAAIRRTVDLLDLARSRGWPVAHSRIVFMENDADANPFTVKVPGMLTLKESGRASHIVSELAPTQDEMVVCKTVPSAFFGTALTPWLLSKGVDTLLVAGATTSGCVRASVVDAMSHGLRVTVISDCVGDRAEGPHAANLFDMEQKYADVMDLDRFREILPAARQ
jgi:maleamate amidohydrolase